MTNPITINIEYYAQLREERGLDNESISTTLTSATELYSHLQKEYKLSLKHQSMRVAVNNHFVTWDTQLKNGDSVIFIPPVAGG